MFRRVSTAWHIRYPLATLIELESILAPFPPTTRTDCIPYRLRVRGSLALPTGRACPRCGSVTSKRMASRSVFVRAAPRSTCQSVGHYVEWTVRVVGWCRGRRKLRRQGWHAYLQHAMLLSIARVRRSMLALNASRKSLAMPISRSHPLAAIATHNGVGCFLHREM